MDNAELNGRFWEDGHSLVLLLIFCLPPAAMALTSAHIRLFDEEWKGNPVTPSVIQSTVAPHNHCLMTDLNHKTCCSTLPRLFATVNTDRGFSTRRINIKSQVFRMLHTAFCLVCVVCCLCLRREACNNNNNNSISITWSCQCKC